MTCRDIMTANPSCCLPTDTAASAAQIMKSEDVGPVPVVEDHGSKKLAGIVTDRDLAVKVVAEGRDPNMVRLSEIMSIGLATCSPEDHVDDAMQLMSDHQVRRVPIVDSRGCLVGIVAQADVARHVNERQVGGVVEDISGRSGLWGNSFRRSEEVGYGEASNSGVGSVLLTAAIGLGIGAGLMYIFDPNSGRRRRAVTKDRAMTWTKSAAREVNRRTRDFTGSAENTGETEGI